MVYGTGQVRGCREKSNSTQIQTEISTQINVSCSQTTRSPILPTFLVSTLLKKQGISSNRPVAGKVLWCSKKHTPFQMTLQKYSTGGILTKLLSICLVKAHSTRQIAVQPLRRRPENQWPCPDYAPQTTAVCCHKINRDQEGQNLEEGLVVLPLSPVLTWRQSKNRTWIFHPLTLAVAWHLLVIPNEKRARLNTTAVNNPGCHWSADQEAAFGSMTGFWFPLGRYNVSSRWPSRETKCKVGNELAANHLDSAWLANYLNWHTMTIWLEASAFMQMLPFFQECYWEQHCC